MIEKIPPLRDFGSDAAYRWCSKSNFKTALSIAVAAVVLSVATGTTSIAAAPQSLESDVLTHADSGNFVPLGAPASFANELITMSILPEEIARPHARVAKNKKNKPKYRTFKKPKRPAKFRNRREKFEYLIKYRNYLINNSRLTGGAILG